jgi:hypothetical protein
MNNPSARPGAASIEATGAHAPRPAPWRTRFLWACVSLPLVACGGGGGSGATANAAPSPAPAPAPGPAPAPAPAPTPPLAATKITLAGQPLGTANWPDGDTTSGGQGQAIDGVTCASSEAYHIHTHLSIFLNGQQQRIPSHIGLVTGCNYQTHTHDHSGVIHLEADASATITLGQLFAVWGMPLSNSNVAGLTDPSIVTYVYDNIGATPTPPQIYSGDITALQLAPHREITIQIGSALTELQTYDWSMVNP